MNLIEKIDIENEVIKNTIKECIEISNRCGFILSDDEIDFKPTEKLGVFGFFKIPKVSS